MAITADSSQWTGERDDAPPPVPVVWGEFESEAARDNALARLKAAGARGSGARHATSGAVVTPEHAANEDQVQPLATASAPRPRAGHPHAAKPPRADGPVVGLLAPDAETRAGGETALREAGVRRVLV